MRPALSHTLGISAVVRRHGIAAGLGGRAVMAAAPATPMETYKLGETDDTDCVL
jgi:hypothetical protein